MENEKNTTDGRENIKDNEGPVISGKSGDAAVHVERRYFMQARNIIYYILGIIEVLLALRFLFKVLGASTKSSFVSALYSLSEILVIPFSGIFKNISSGDTGARFIFEPATVIAMIIYGIIAVGLVRLAKLRITD